MKGIPYDWNVVLLGAWNLAILTPEGVAKRVFELPPGTPVEVQVAIDQLAPLRVIYGQQMVIPSKDTLLIQPEISNITSLSIATAAAARVLVSLPETPVRAAGINFRYKYDTIPASLQNYLGSPLDNALAETDFSTTARQLKRTMSWKGQSLNLDITEDQGPSCKIEFNFHNPSTDSSALAEWMKELPAMASTVEKLVSEIFQIQVEHDNGSQTASFRQHFGGSSLGPLREGIAGVYI